MQEILKAYLLAIKDIKESDKEHTYRPHLYNFLTAINGGGGGKSSSLESKNNIYITHEPNNDKEGRGAPDFLITKDSLTLGYIENKRVNAPLDEIAQSNQIKKYFRLSSNIMLTDYLRFCLLHQDEKGKISIKQECRICEHSQLKALAKNPKIYDVDSKARELTELFTLFFSQSPSPINTAKEFANALAQRTRILNYEIIRNEHNDSIQDVFKIFKVSLYKDLEFLIFADNFAQTLTYSLFLARLNNTTNEKINLDNAYNFIPESFPLIRAMSRFLNILKELERHNNLKKMTPTSYLLEEIIEIINHIDISRIIQDLNASMQKDLFGNYIHKDPYLHLYEDFLKEYDPELRELRGVYYTPAPVVRFIIDSIDLTLQKDFNKKGLKSALDKDSDITLLDFATGTGTFLLEAFRKALESSNKNSVKYNPKALIQRFYGFEFLIAPYTIAHLKISQALKEEFSIELEYNDKKKEYKSLNIRLTNTLYSNKQEEELNKQVILVAGMRELAEEFKESQKIKDSPQILIITGNPPYSGASANKGLYEDEVRIAYGLEPKLAELTKQDKEHIEKYFEAKIAMPQKKEEYYKDWYKTNESCISTFKIIFEKHKLQNEKNPKWLLDDYVKFIRFAESKIEKQEGGIFAFISNNAFLDNPTFRGMRYHLLKTFDKIYILDLHGNTRKKETTPSGTKDDNVFDIMQGVSINIFVKLPCESKSTHHAESLSACHTESTPTCHTERSEVSKNTKNKDISHSLNMTNNLATIYHYDLYGKRRDKYEFLYSNTLDSIQWQILTPQNPFYLFIPQNKSLRIEYDKGWSVKDIFKVFSTGICSQRDSVVIHKTRQSIETLINDFCNMSKDEIVKKYNIQKDGRDWQIQRAIDSVKKSQQNKTGAITQIHYKPFDFYWTYFNGESRAFMAYPRAEVMQHFLQDSNDMWVENFTQEFRDFIDSKYNEHFSPEQILGYIYAVLFHKDYREKYLDFLKIDFPKIPFVESKEKFLALSDLGLELLNTHLMTDITERERERERTENDENDLQYRLKCSTTIQNKRFVAMCDSDKYTSRFIANGQWQHGSRDNIPTLSLQGSLMKNIGLVCDRGSKLSHIDNIFITDSIIDLHLVGSGSYVFPLYLTQRI